MPKFSVYIGTSPFKNIECPDVRDWLIETILKMKRDPRVGEIYLDRRDDTPAYAVRNWFIERAKELKADIMIQVDSDMKPDYLRQDARPFWDTSFEFLINHNGPCIICAPYCGKAPVHNIFGFRWRSAMNPEKPVPHFSLEQFTREEAAILGGIQEVAAMPTGLIMIDMRCFEYLEPPHFQYEWKDKTESERVSTEDVFFTRNASLAGIPVYCNFDAWCGHWKEECVPPPIIMTVDMVRDQFKKALANGVKKGEKLVHVGGCRPKQSMSAQLHIDKGTLKKMADDNSGPTSRLHIPGYEEVATRLDAKDRAYYAGAGPREVATDVMPGHDDITLTDVGLAGGND